MKKVALVFVIAVLVPSLVLAWLAMRSLRDQQFLLERQQSQLDQHTTDALAQSISDYLTQQQQAFSAQVESLATEGDARTLASQFDDELRKHWPLAEVGFCVTTAGKILSPQPNARPDAQMFRLDNSGFLGNREPVEVYLAANTGSANGQAYTSSAGSSSWLASGRGREIQSALTAAQTRSSPGPDSQKQSIPQVAMLEKSSGASPAPTVPNSVANSFASFGGGGGGGGGLAPSNVSNATQIAALSAGYPQTDSAARNQGTENAVNYRRNQANTIGFAINNSEGNAAAPPVRSANQVQNVQDQQGFLIASNKMAYVAASPAKSLPQESGGVPDATPQNADTATTAVDVPRQAQVDSGLNYKAAQSRAVTPQSASYWGEGKMASKDSEDSEENLSKVIPAEAEFRQLVGNQTDGMLARFLQNKLKVMCWHKLSSEPDLIFGAQLNLNLVVAGLRGLVQPNRPTEDEVALAILDDNARPLVVSRPGFQANWKRPFVATEIGDALPHWEVAAYLTDPERLTQAAHTARLTLGLLIAMLVIAIGFGSLLIVRSLSAELKLARQKTDFVSNVSHELKTPLTSIRMFSELLAEGRVADHAKQHSYLQIISAEAGRLTRLINNVLDFSRMERGEKKYNFQSCDLAEIVGNTANTLRPHLEAGGYKFDCELPETPLPIRGDADALSQVIVNLLSNSEKYSNGGKEVSLRLAARQSPLPHAEVSVMDRGPGVPRGSEEKIFETFYRAHDSLSSGIQGSGLGLTIARQIARAHGGDVVYEPREGGGSNFILRLPLKNV